jgi:hypothetical protein
MSNVFLLCYLLLPLLSPYSLLTSDCTSLGIQRGYIERNDDEHAFAEAGNRAGRQQDC